MESETYLKNNSDVKENKSQIENSQSAHHYLNNSSKLSNLTKQVEEKFMKNRKKAQSLWLPTEIENPSLLKEQILERSLSHHNPELCLCSDCNCGRHLCQIKSNLKPILTKTTVYKQSYHRKHSFENKINRVWEYDRLKGPHLEMMSNYQKDFDPKKSERSMKNKPEDLIKTGGPLCFLTSYSAGFPGHKGANQYVKPVEKLIKSDLPIMSRTTYMRAYIPKSIEKNKAEKIPDNLRSQSIWIGKSSYGDFYQQPNPQDYPKPAKHVQKLKKDSNNYHHQFETTYGKSFMGTMPLICPARTKLSQRSKLSLRQNGSRIRVSQNLATLQSQTERSPLRHSYK